MVTLSIKADFSDIERKLKRLSKEQQLLATPAALNKTISKAYTYMVREISGEFNIGQSEVRARLRVIRARRDFLKFTASLDPFATNKRGRSLNLIRFLEKSVTVSEGKKRKRDGTQNQLRFQIKRGSPRKMIEGAFIGNRGRTVFIREGKERLPIKGLSTIDVPQMFNTRRIQSAVLKRVESDLVIEFDRAIKAVIAGAIK